MNSKFEKLSYEELIKALDCCAHTIETNMCGECPAAKYKAGTCDDLVKLQAAEMLQAFKTENKKLKDTTFGCDLSITQIKSEAIKGFAEKSNNMITEIYNKHIFGNNDLEAEEKDAIINFSDDVTYGFANLVKETVGEQV